MIWGWFLLLILSLLLFVGGPDSHSNRIIKDIWDTGHVALFGLLMYLLLGTPRLKSRKPWIHFCFTTLLCITAGIAIEAAQLIVGRSFEPHDLSSNLLGGYLGFMLYVAVDKTGRNKVRLLMVPLILLILFVTFRPVYISTIDTFVMEKQFPVLCDYETAHELARWDTNLATLHYDSHHVRQGRRAMRIEFQPGKYPDITLQTFHKNWQGCKTLQFSVYSTHDSTIPVNLKVYDSMHIYNGYAFEDRFNSTLTLNPGWNDFTVPMDRIASAPHDRPMDLSEIASFSLFLSNLDRPLILYLDDLRLSR